jgi:hypothetical protein
MLVFNQVTQSVFVEGHHASLGTGEEGGENNQYKQNNEKYR